MKRWMWILLCGIYGILLAALIVLQCLVMRGDILRLFANILAVLLACPAVAVLFLLGRSHDSGFDNVGKNMAEKTGTTVEDMAERSGDIAKEPVTAVEDQGNIVAKNMTKTKNATEGTASQPERKIQTMENFYAWAEQQKFSAREQEVGWLIYKGYTNRQIAQELYIAETTVKKHAGHIYEKAGVSGRKEFRSIL